ncbi:hypothetical protein [Streptomyces sp. NRRL S-350]|uniref:hypothetical protein n=1 Tax=Streptomyces sp. NRRL S-350 TaxID=1463902 RepID=UPI0004C08F01|nr:hypothetical protein [Streptomyces sp. NRRL S-350]
MADALLQDLWLHHTADVAVNTLTIHTDHVTVHAATTGDEAGCPSCGTVSTRSRQLKEVLARVPALATTAEHVRTFAELMNDRRGRELKDWITRVQQDQVLGVVFKADQVMRDHVGHGAPS